MASVTWSKTSNGNVLDTNGVIVGSGDGAGTITLVSTPAAILCRTAFTLTITEGVTVKFTNINNQFNITKTGGAGHLVVAGTELEPCLFTSGFAVPTPGDFPVAVQIGENVGGGTRPSFTADWLTIEYPRIAIQGSGAQSDDVLMNNCTFRKIARNHIAGTCNANGTPWRFIECVFDKCPSDPQNATDNAAPLIDLGISGADRLTLDHCTISMIINNTLASPAILSANVNGTNIDARNCIISSFNQAPAQTIELAETAGTTGTVTGNWNWYDVEALGDYTPAANDVSKDPEFFDASCA